jgi:hypothetical protein
VYFLYSFVTLMALVVLSPYFAYQALRHNKYVGSLGQRFGYLPVSFNLDGEESIWVHAVSVGEVLAARPLLVDLRRRYPRLRLFLSTTTLAGQQLARRSIADVDGVFYFPFDWAFTVRRTLALVNPRLFVMIETGRREGPERVPVPGYPYVPVLFALLVLGLTGTMLWQRVSELVPAVVVLASGAVVYAVLRRAR